MSYFSHDINKFDELVKNETWRKAFLDGFEYGWKEESGLKGSRFDFDKHFKEMIQIFRAGIQANPEKFGVALGWFMCDLREHPMVLLTKYTQLIV